MQLYEHRDSVDANKLIKLLLRNVDLKKGANVLDLACGNGRHSVLFAKKGFRTLGIDLSDYLIRMANKKKRTLMSGNSKLLRFEIQDMRNIRHQNEFDLVVNLFSSFGYFNSDLQNEKVIGSISKALKPGGWFLFDFLNEHKLRRSIVPFTMVNNSTLHVAQIRYIEKNICFKKILLFDRNSRGKFRQYSEQVKLYNYRELKSMFNKFSLKIYQTFGDYDGRKFDKVKSDRLVIIACKN